MRLAFEWRFRSLEITITITITITNVMGKVSEKHKMRIQTLHEQRLGYRVIVAKYPERKFSLNRVKAICKRVDVTGSGVVRKAGKLQVTVHFSSEI